MIQELLGGSASGVSGGGFNIGGGGGGGERKLFSSSNGLQNTNPSHHFSPSPSPTPSSSSTPTANKAAGHDSKTSTTTTSNAHDQNLRCPRCDSSNTKFCYYNNYNLTQPRHFCKTCRRYWTKGGALRNVPIGGGCRKNRSSTTTVVAAAASAANNKSSGNNNTSKFKNLASEIGIIRPSGPFDHIYHGHGHHLQYSNPNIVWASPQNSHLLSLLRSATTATQFQNPNPNPNPSSAVKEEGRMVGTHMLTDPAGAAPTDLGLDPMNIGQVPSLGLCSSFWKNNQLGQENGFTAGGGGGSGGGGGGDHQNPGIQDLYQRLRLSSSTTANNNYYSTDHDNSAAAAAGGGALLLSNSNINNNNVLTSSSTAPSTSILDSAPVAAGAGGADPLMGYCWNPAFSSWSDHLPTTNGAYP